MFSSFAERIDGCCTGIQRICLPCHRRADRFAMQFCERSCSRYSRNQTAIDCTVVTRPRAVQPCPSIGNPAFSWQVDVFSKVLTTFHNGVPDFAATFGMRGVSLPQADPGWSCGLCSPQRSACTCPGNPETSPQSRTKYRRT